MAGYTLCKQITILWFFNPSYQLLPASAQVLSKDNYSSGMCLFKHKPCSVWNNDFQSNMLCLHICYMYDNECWAKECSSMNNTRQLITQTVRKFLIEICNLGLMQRIAVERISHLRLSRPYMNWLTDSCMVLCGHPMTVPSRHDFLKRTSPRCRGSKTLGPSGDNDQVCRIT